MAAVGTMNDAARQSPLGEHKTTTLGTASSEGRDSAVDSTKVKSKPYPEDTDNRGLFDPKSKYAPEYLDAQKREQRYIATLLALSLVALAVVGLGILDQGFLRMGVDATTVGSARKYEWICAGGLLGGTVYAAKWFYHAIAKGLWHEDRKAWRYLSPWISLGTTVGIATLIDVGFFKSTVSDKSGMSAEGLTGMGFLVGYLSDRFLAKMKEVTHVLFGESESHYKRGADSQDKSSRGS